MTARSREEAEDRRRASHREWASREQQTNPERAAERRRKYRLKYPEKVKAQQQAYYDSLPAEVKWARTLKRAHKMTPGDFEAMWSSQGGRCYLCNDMLKRDQTYIEHDHRCCPRAKSCATCRRGLSCPHCNFVIGQAFDDPERLRRIADNLEAVIASRPGISGGT